MKPNNYKGLSLRQRTPSHTLHIKHAFGNKIITTANGKRNLKNNLKNNGNSNGKNTKNTNGKGINGISANDKHAKFKAQALNSKRKKDRQMPLQNSTTCQTTCP